MAPTPAPNAAPPSTETRKRCRLGMPCKSRALTSRSPAKAGKDAVVISMTVSRNTKIFDFTDMNEFPEGRPTYPHYWVFLFVRMTLGYMGDAQSAAAALENPAL